MNGHMCSSSPRTITCRYDGKVVVIRIGDTDNFNLSEEEAGRFYDQIVGVPGGCIVVADVTLSHEESQVLAAQIVRVFEEHETPKINWQKEGF